MAKAAPLRALGFVVPWILGLLVFILYPFLSSLYYSFTDYSILTPPLPNGLANYRELVFDPVFRRAVANTWFFALLAIPSGLFIAIGLAKALHAPVRGTAFFRACVYIPHLVPTVASTILWMWLLNPDQGLFNAFLRYPLEGLDQLGRALDWPQVTGWKPPSFLADDRFFGLDFKNRQLVFGALPSLVLVNLWGVGQMAVIYLAKLQDVPQALYEAARLDGASGWAIFRHVELPQLSPLILFNLVMGIIGAFQVFSEPFILTGGSGGPDYATYLIPMFIYHNAFEYLRMGYACAASWILFGLIALLTIVAFRIGQRKVYYAGA